MLLGKPDTKIGYDQLSQYIEGWLQYKENKKYERFWFVLRGNVIHGRDLSTAYLFCFKDLNIHVEDNAVGSVEIHSHDKVEFLKSAGNKPMKCDFTILLSETKFHFRADDDISRERWIYALCDLIGKHQPPSDLPTERNNIKASSSNPQKKSDKKGAFHRSKTVELPSTTGLNDRRRSTPSSTSATGSTSNASLPRSRTIDVVDGPHVAPPPRPVISLPFMLDPHARLTELKWFYPGMKREEAQEKLSKCPPGYYLLRASESKVGSYTLTFKDSDRIKNHMITQSSDRQYRFHNSEVDTAFPSPHKAVEFYMIKKHSKTITPVPYCDDCDESDPDYLLPSEMNVNTQTTSQTRPRNAGGYTNRELPPTPTSGVCILRNLSIQDDVNNEAPYLNMSDGKVESPGEDNYLTMREPSDYPNKSVEHVPAHNKHNSSKTKNSKIAREHVPQDDTDGYLTAGRPSPYNNHTPVDDSESYLEISKPEKTSEANDGEVVSSSDDEPEYFEYEKPGDAKPSINNPPAKMKKNSVSFSHYDDFRLADYENQHVIDGRTKEAPPLPPRTIKPELPPRRDTAY